MKIENDFKQKPINVMAYFTESRVMPVSFSFPGSSFKVEEILSREDGTFSDLLYQAPQQDIFAGDFELPEKSDKEASGFWVKTNNGTYKIAFNKADLTWHLIGIYAAGKYHLAS